MRVSIAAAMLLSSLTLAGCDKQADIASRNLSEAADNFEVQRRVVFYNGITGRYILEIEGRCSLGNSDGAKRMTVTCKTGPSEFRKHFLGISDNVTFFAEQVEPVTVSTYRNRIVWTPSAIVPSIELR